MNIKISGFFLLNLCRFFWVVWEHGIRRKVQHPCLLQFYTTEQDRSDLTATLLSSPPIGTVAVTTNWRFSLLGTGHIGFLYFPVFLVPSFGLAREEGGRKR